MKVNASIGDKIKFKEERNSYLVRARSERFIICTKPFSPKKTFLYSILDLKEGIRGPDNYYCRHNYENPEDLLIAISELESGKLKVSGRHRTRLQIEKIILAKKLY